MELPSPGSGTAHDTTVDSHVFQTAPRRPGRWIDRPRVDALLADAGHRSLTVLVAPAGSGKTAALAGWSERGNADSAPTPPVRWLVARPGLRADRFASAILVTAGQRALPEARDGRARTPEQVRREVLRRLYGGNATPQILVVDDAHLLHHDLLNLLDGVLRAHPDAVRIVLATRHDLALPIVDLELAGSVQVIRGHHLTFTRSEASALVSAHGVTGEDDRDALITRSRGWAAALVLGAHALAGASDPVTARATLLGTNQPILDYLLGEVFTTLPARVRHVLLCTGANESVTAEQAVVLSGEPEAPKLLADLAQAGLLVTVRGRASLEDAVWTYHPLLRELLRRHVGPGGGERPLYAAAQLRGAAYYLAHGAVAAAVEHAVRAAYVPRLVDLLVEHGTTLLATGHHQLLGSALDIVPTALRTGHPALAAVVALHRCADRDFEAATRLAPLILQEAARTIDAPSDAVSGDAHGGALVADAAILRLWLARAGWSDPHAALENARALLGCAAAADPPSAGHDHASSNGGLASRWALSLARKTWLMTEVGGAELATGDLDGASAHLGEAVAIARALGHRAMTATILSYQCVMAVTVGAGRTAGVLAEETLEIATNAGLPGVPVLARAYLGLAASGLHRLDLDAAARNREHVEQLQATETDPMVESLATTLDIGLAVTAGGLEAARDQLGRTLVDSGDPQSFLERRVTGVRGRLALLSGSDPVAAQQVLAEEFPEDTPTALAGWVALHRGDGNRALATFTEVLNQPQRTRWLYVPIEAAAGRTRALLDLGDREAARDALRDTLLRCAPERLVYPLFLWLAAAPAFAGLLDELAAEPDAPSFVGEARATLAAHRADHPNVEQLAPLPPLSSAGRSLQQNSSVRSRIVRRRAGGVELTRREADVLAELALGGSYIDIGQTLFVSENTVKTHVAALYRKLGSRRRAEALQRARTIGLL
ncbi:LuxR C-terminal-related transcriptional regulator [Cryptosporangium minutisporangium]|uniref:LuxR family transcriptional regulator n=1 Tax=Cryptosporangium minutisporangium TaxID=113569 RepID=A0ABP6SSX0_9ACTN